MPILDQLKLLEELEQSLADYYRTLSDLFSADEEARTLFARLSNDEIAHRDMIRFQGRLLYRTPAAFHSISLDLDEVKRSIEDIRQTRLEPGPSLEEALRTAARFERDNAEGHSRNALVHSSPELSRLLDKLGNADRDHLGELETFSRGRGLL